MLGLRTRPVVAIATVASVAVLLAGCSPILARPGRGGGNPAPIISPAPQPIVGRAIAGCPTFPATNPWNQDISALPVRTDSAAIVANIQSSGSSALHPDFGGGGAYGIPFKVVPSTQSKVAINYTAYGSESDPGPFPIPANTPIEGGSASSGDRHTIVVQQGTCHLYELYRAFWRGNHWDADSGVNWDLNSNGLRPRGWTSADAAGLPIFPGLARLDEAQAGVINHALRVTFSRTRRGYVLPATHSASSSTDPTRPAMGMRFRLKANVDISKLTGSARVIAVALKRYGLIVADNGSNWFITGTADPGWNDTNLNQLKGISGNSFEVVNTGNVLAG